MSDIEQIQDALELLHKIEEHAGVLSDEFNREVRREIEWQEASLRLEHKVASNG